MFSSKPFLDVACTVRGSAVIVTDADRDRLHAVLEVGADRRAEETELIFVRRLDTDDRARGKEVRAQVEGTARLERRNPILVGCNNLIDSLEEHLLRDRRHHEAFGRIHHALGILVRTERHDLAIFRLICLKAFEYFLAILQDACALIDNDIGVLRESAFAPFAIFVVCYITFRDRLIAESKICPVNIYICHVHAPFLLSK